MQNGGGEVGHVPLNLETATTHSNPKPLTTHTTTTHTRMHRASAAPSLRAPSRPYLLPRPVWFSERRLRQRPTNAHTSSTPSPNRPNHMTTPRPATAPPPPPSAAAEVAAANAAALPTGDRSSSKATPSSPGKGNPDSNTTTKVAGTMSEVDELLNLGLKPRTMQLITLVLACANAADAVEVLAVGFFLTVYTNKDGSELSGADKSVLTGSIYMGMLVGGLVGGWLSDVVGRKRTLTCSLALNGVAGLVSAASPNLGCLATFRVLAGIGVGASVPCLFTLGAELFPVQIRGVYLSYIASFWMVGSIYAAAAAWIILGLNVQGERILPGWTWRAFVIVAVMPVFLTLALALVFLPESPRYLIHKGRYAEAAKNLHKLTGRTVSPDALVPAAGDDDGYHYVDKETDPLTGAPLAHPLAAVAAADKEEGMTTSASGLSSGPSSSRRSHRRPPMKGFDRMKAVFGGPLRLSTLRLMVVWFTLCFGTYGLSTWISNIFKVIGIENEFLPTFLFALANLPGNVASFVLIERLGRKRLLAYSMLLAAGSAFLFAFTSSRAVWLAVVAACLFQAFSVAGWNALDALSTESFPTATRTTGMGLLSGTGRFASLIAMFVNGSLEHNVALLFTVTGATTICGSMTAFWLPYEPTGQSLDGVGGRWGGGRGGREWRSFEPVVEGGDDGEP